MQRYERILVCTDFSDPSLEVAHRGAELAGQYKAALTLLHVIEHFPEDLPARDVPPENVDPATYYRDRASRQLADIAIKLSHEDRVQEIVVSTGSAKSEIVRFAEKARIDLIVIGSHGHGFIGTLGSTTMGVVHDALCDTMVIRTGTLTRLKWSAKKAI